MQTILVVDDDVSLQNYLKELLTENDFYAKIASDGSEALNILSSSIPDLVVLDLKLPDISGESVCQEIRKKHKDLPIIVLTGKNETSDVVNLLNLGADDYISKPFVADEFLARIRTRLKNSEGDDSELKLDDLILNRKTFEVSRNGKLINLSPREYKLLEYLILNKNQVLTREMILNRIWVFAPDIETRVVDVFISSLRKKIDKGHKKKLIHSARGFGYSIKE